ncbi:MAG TPA: hypothetical protein VGJ09_07575, partial [Bryobacteraceae bacterium]
MTDTIESPAENDLAAAAKSPWWFVPTLYFLQGLPYFLVAELFAVVYKNLGIDNLQITLWTGLAVLPWTFKMFWAPLVELNATRRKWTLAMQILLIITLAFSAAAMTSNAYFGLTVGAMFVIATLSATHDIACDGLYLMSLDRSKQAAFSGVLSASSRMARLFVTGFVLFLVGLLQGRGLTLRGAWAVG